METGSRWITVSSAWARRAAQGFRRKCRCPARGGGLVSIAQQHRQPFLSGSRPSVPGQRPNDQKPSRFRRLHRRRIQRRVQTVGRGSGWWHPGAEHAPPARSPRDGRCGVGTGNRLGDSAPAEAGPSRPSCRRRTTHRPGWVAGAGSVAAPGTRAKCSDAGLSVLQPVDRNV